MKADIFYLTICLSLPHVLHLPPQKVEGTFKFLQGD